MLPRRPRVSESFSHRHSSAVRDAVPNDGGSYGAYSVAVGRRYALAEPDLLWRERAACGHYRQLHSSRRLDRSRSVPEGRGCDFVGVVHRQTQQEAVIQGNHRERVKINRELPNRRTGVRGCHGVSQRPRIAQQSARLVHRLARTTIADKQRNKSTRLGITLHSHDVGNRPDALVNIAAKGLTAEPSCREPQDGERNHLVPWFPSPREQLDARLVQHPRCEYACFIIHVREVASGQLPRTRRSGRHGLRRGPASTCARACRWQLVREIFAIPRASPT